MLYVPLLINNYSIKYLYLYIWLVLMLVKFYKENN